jgi:hypothetical protein
VKITKQLLKQIIREEIDSVLEVEMDTRRVEESEHSSLDRITELGRKYLDRIADKKRNVCGDRACSYEELKNAAPEVEAWYGFVERERKCAADEKCLKGRKSAPLSVDDYELLKKTN